MSGLSWIYTAAFAGVLIFIINKPNKKTVPVSESGEPFTHKVKYEHPPQIYPDMRP